MSNTMLLQKYKFRTILMQSSSNPNRRSYNIFPSVIISAWRLRFKVSFLEETKKVICGKKFLKNSISTRIGNDSQLYTSTCAIFDNTMSKLLRAIAHQIVFIGHSIKVPNNRWPSSELLFPLLSERQFCASTPKQF